MTDKELIQYLVRLLEYAIAYGDTWYPSQDEINTLKEELSKRGIRISL